MARILFENVLGLLLVAALVNGRPPAVERRELSKDEAVREMYELLHARRQPDESEQSSLGMAPSSTTPPILIDEHNGLKEDGYSSHTQLCTDALTFLSTGSSDHEKRNTIINHVYNICIRPGLNNDVMGQFLDFARNTEEGDWSNWPGFDLLTTPQTALTTEDYWQQLLDELFGEDIVGDGDSDGVITPPATTPIMNLYSSTEGLEALLGDFINMLEEEDGDVTTSKQPTEPSELENSLEAFLQLLEQEEAQDKDVMVSNTPQTTTGAEPSSTIDFEAAFNDFLNMIEVLESEENSTTPQITTVSEPSTTVDIEAALNDFWNMFDELENDAITTPSAQVDDNLLPPVDLSKRSEMKKRLLKMLAKSLADKKEMKEIPSEQRMLGRHGML